MSDTRSTAEKEEVLFYENVDDSSGQKIKQELDLEHTTSANTVSWTFTRCIAIASLCIAYVGMSFRLSGCLTGVV